jgi:hypothetical protein
LKRLLSQFGKEDACRGADDWVDDANIGYPQQKLYVNNLRLLLPSIVKQVQSLLADFPGWEIVVAVSIPRQGDHWPMMGLTLRFDEIIDGLQTQYFPKEFQSIAYDGSRRGTERD